MEHRLWEAACKGDINGLHNLLQEDPFMLKRSLLSTDSDTVLHVAAMAGKNEFVEEILKLEPGLAKGINKDGFSSIHIASANGYVETTTVFLKVNRDLARVKSSDGRTALHFAVVNGWVEVIKELVGYCHECVDDVTIKGETTLHLAVKNNQFEAFRTIVDLYKKLNIKELLNARDEDGNTLLHLASARELSKIVRFLLGDEDQIEKGTIEVNITNKNGLTALDVLDVVQQMSGKPTEDYKLRELLIRAGAQRASELKGIYNAQLGIPNTAAAAAAEAVSEPLLEIDSPLQYLLKELPFLRSWQILKKIKDEVSKAPTRTQNVLLVVAVLTASVTYQAILNPPSGINATYPGAALATDDAPKFVLFMIPNSISYFVSLAVISVIIDGYPLKALLGVAVRGMGASYLIGLFIIARRTKPTLIISFIALLDLLVFCYWLLKRWFQVLRS